MPRRQMYLLIVIGLICSILPHTKATATLDGVIYYDNRIVTATDFVAYIDCDNKIIVRGRPQYMSYDVFETTEVKLLAANMRYRFYQTLDDSICISGRENGVLFTEKKDVKQLVATEDAAFALMEDGTVSAMYYCNSLKAKRHYVQFNLWKDIVYLTAGADFIVGLCKDGSVVVDGNTVMIDKDEVCMWNDVVQIHAGEASVIGLTSDYKILFECNYYNLPKYSYSIPETISDWTSWNDVVQVATGHNFCVGLRENGTIIIDGWYDYYHTEYGIDEALAWTDIVYIEAYTNCLVAVQSDGQILSIVNQ